MMVLTRPRELVFSGLIGLTFILLVMGAGYWNGGRTVQEPVYVTASIDIAGNTSGGGSRNTAAITDWKAHTEIIGNHRLPKIVDGTRVFDLYRRPAVIPPLLVGETPKPLLGIMILGLGFNKVNSMVAINALPEEAGVGLSPLAPYANVMLDAARNSGREIWLHAATQSRLAGYDEGASAIKFRAPAPENVARLHTMLGRLSHYVGVVFSPYSSVPGSNEDMEPIIQELGLRGLGFGPMDSVPNLAIEQGAINNNAPLLPPARAVSTPPFPDSVRRYLDETVQIARDNGGAVAVITEPNPIVIKAVVDWVNAHRDVDFTLVPPSGLAAK